MSSEGTKTTRQDEASAWFAAERAGVMLVEQKEEFDAWRSDPRNAAALQAMRDLWNDLSVLKGKSPEKPVPRRTYSFAAIALTLALIGVGGSVGWITLSREPSIHTVAGEQKTQSLPDGSVLAVNVASDVTYSIKDKSRLAKVLNGEAAFAVAKDAARPFIVRVGDYDVYATGTAFNVRRRDGLVEVAVSEGQVTICRAGADQTILASIDAGQSLLFPALLAGGAFRADTREIATAQVSEWRTRVVSYEDALVRDVVEDFNRYFDQKLRVEQEPILERRVTIRLQVDDRERAIATLASLLEVRVMNDREGQMLVAK